MLCGFFPHFPPFQQKRFFKGKKKVFGILCITPAEGLYLPSGGLFFFFPSMGPTEGKGFQYFQIGMWGSPEELLGN